MMQDFICAYSLDFVLLNLHWTKAFGKNSIYKVKPLKHTNKSNFSISKYVIFYKLRPIII